LELEVKQGKSKQPFKNMAPKTWSPHLGSRKIKLAAEDRIEGDSDKELKKYVEAFSRAEAPKVVQDTSTESKRTVLILRGKSTSQRKSAFAYSPFKKGSLTVDDTCTLHQGQSARDDSDQEATSQPTHVRDDEIII
jgi:hypothetical protein